MPFTEAEEFYGPLAIPQSLDVTPEPKTYNASVLGAAFRRENEMVSAATSFQFDPEKPFDPDFRPWEAIQGTDYERYASRFVGAQDSEDIARMKAQIDRETEDRAVLDASGAAGFMAQMGAAILSPTSFLPGGAIVKGGKGVSIGMTALKVGASAAGATAIQEAFLHSSQQTRTTEESAFAIGGSFILGGVLGAAAGKMGALEFKAASKQVEEALVLTKEYDDALRSMGAADSKVPAGDLELRNEFIFSAIDKIPVLRGFVRSDPILRAQLSPNVEARRALVELAETPLQYKVNEEGRGVRGGETSVEARIRDRERTELASAIAHIKQSYGEYWKDGPVGVVGTFTAPITARFSNLVSKERKMTAPEFMEEVGKAMRVGDKHPIPQVQSAADALRREIFDKIKDDAIDVGMFDPDLQVKNAESYFSRVYKIEKIAQHFGDGTENDILPVLVEEFKKRRAMAETVLANDDTLTRKEFDLLHQKEVIRENRKAFDRAREKAADKRERAKASVSREKAVERASSRMRKAFRDRQSDLEAKTPDNEAKKILREMLADARGLKRLEPQDVLGAVRAMGGIGEDVPGELKAVLGEQYLTTFRRRGIHPDYVRERLVELGYLQEGADLNDLYDVLGRAARGEKIYAQVEDAAEIARYEAALQFAKEMEELGVDYTRPFDEVVAGIYGDVKVTKAKAGEAGRAAKRAGGVSEAALARIEKAIDRLDEAKARLRDLDEEIGPRVRQEIKDAVKEAQKLVSEIRDLKKKKAAEEYYAGKSDEEIATAAQETVAALMKMRPGEHSYGVAMASPTHARVLDVPDLVLEPWLESNAEVILGQYFRSMVPDIELTRKFGDAEASGAIRAMQEETLRMMQAAKGEKERAKIKAEGQERVKDFEGMRDRMRGRYGAPSDPRNGWVVAGRVGRTLSYTGYLGGMMLSAIPDVAGVIGRGGVVDAFGAGATTLMDPKRMFSSMKEAAEWGAHAEWWLNSRAISIGEVLDQYGSGSKLERAMAAGASSFSVMTGMIPWNVGWKSVGGAVVATRMGKAIEAMAKGTATKKQKLLLGANEIEPWMADRIAKQIEAHGDKEGGVWLMHGADWTDKEAFEAFKRAMNREFDLMVVTPGQDKPLSFSTEGGKFILQFKSFGFSAHHRILLAGLQRADADVLAQFTAAVLLGGLVSNIKAWQGGYEAKEGGAFWQDAIDRSGLTGWLMEPYNAASAITGGFFGATEPVSRFQARSYGAGLMGPTFDMASGVLEGLNAMASGKHSYRDVRKLMRPIPGNNIWYLLPLFRQVEEAAVHMTGAKPRPE